MLRYARALLGGSASGGSSALDTQQVTSGSSGSAALENRRRGYISTVNGSIYDGFSNLYAGAPAIRSLYWDEDGDLIQFEVAGVQSNSGWAQMTINGTQTFSRASASFSTATGNSVWTWSSAGFTAGTNPFGAQGSVHTVNFT